MLLPAAFGFRTSAFFRVSDFGLRISFAAVPLLAAPHPALPDAIPALRPPRAELPPTFWEQYGWWVAGLGLLALILAGIAVWRLCRPKPPVVVPPEAQAREALEPLRRYPEDGILLSRVSQVLRRYVGAAFGLPPGELTTAEFCRAINGHQQIGPDLAGSVGDFLRQCDERKFAPSPPAQPLGAVAEASKLIEMAEARRAQLLQAATVSTDARKEARHG